jgi:hypothetical protein
MWRFWLASTTAPVAKATTAQTTTAAANAKAKYH